MNAHSIALFLVSNLGIGLVAAAYAIAAYSVTCYLHRLPWPPLCLYALLASICGLIFFITAALTGQEKFEHGLHSLTLIASCLLVSIVGAIAGLRAERRDHIKRTG